MEDNNHITNGKQAPLAVGNGNYHSNGTGGAAAVRPLRRAHSSPDGMPDVLLRMNLDLFDHGRQAGLASGALEPREEDSRALEEHAGAMAQETYREAYDPTQHEHDRLREAEFTRLLAEREEAELAAKHAAAALGEREEESARAQSGARPPETPWALMVAALLVLAISIAPTLHDFIFISMPDELLNWFVSLLSASVVGMFITWGILGSPDASGQRSHASLVALVGGIVVSVGLGALRVAHAEGWGEVVFAVALTVVEVGTILMLEARASALRARHREWAEHEAQVANAAARLAAVRVRLTRCQERAASLNDGVNKHIRYVEERAVRRYNIEEIKAAALKSVLDGYRAGIAETRGHVLGVEKHNHET